MFNNFFFFWNRNVNPHHKTHFTKPKFIWATKKVFPILHSKISIKTKTQFMICRNFISVFAWLIGLLTSHTRTSNAFTAFKLDKQILFSLLTWTESCSSAVIVIVFWYLLVWCLICHYYESHCVIKSSFYLALFVS